MLASLIATRALDSSKQDFWLLCAWPVITVRLRSVTSTFDNAVTTVRGNTVLSATGNFLNVTVSVCCSGNAAVSGK